MTGRQRLLVEAAVVCCFALILVRAVPFRWWSRHLGATDAAGDAGPRHEDAELIREVGRAVERVNRALRGRVTCLMQAVAGKIMLNRRRIPNTLYLGVRTVHEEGGITISAHAWLSSGALMVLGGEGQTQYTVVSRHHSAPDSPAQRSA